MASVPIRAACDTSSLNLSKIVHRIRDQNTGHPKRSPPPESRYQPHHPPSSEEQHQKRSIFVTSSSKPNPYIPEPAPAVEISNVRGPTQSSSSNTGHTPSISIEIETPIYVARSKSSSHVVSQSAHDLIITKAKEKGVFRVSYTGSHLIRSFDRSSTSENSDVMRRYLYREPGKLMLFGKRKRIRVTSSYTFVRLAAMTLFSSMDIRASPEEESLM
ncbi:hypothetical protein M409DRAFT_58370 [Zasmidium cellare ATCC 36951]|uniref:Uncharacterized protein n=1 Tax=Zasmidium cellare ATCC 36951 TaxID=1080233 RepID=A0A6A6C7N1_ZASCE|nr:uncharacterized protein M409DRAFT_58370 [Zasmidium cellare ATCC 36951]KAF2162258.1 hypothetical protein M409DRAFT_58370 [Zasmidium cellare ATCC 36951]